MNSEEKKTFVEKLEQLQPDLLREWIRPVLDPDVGVSLVDLGLIYKIEPQESGAVRLEMTLTTPACPSAPTMMAELKKRLLEHPGVSDVKIDLVWEPKWDPKTMASDSVKDALGIW